MPLYADTSLLASYYVLDANTPRAITALRGVNVPAAFTALHRLELRNAIALAVFRGGLTAAQVQAVWQTVNGDLRSGLLEPTSFPLYATFRRATQLSARHSAATGCRSLDVLHIAAIQMLSLTELYSFDGRQRALAQAVGLTVRP